MGSLFATEEIEVVNEWAIRKEGFLYKQSRHLNKWRQRWVVLHKNYLYTFVKKQIYTNPTEEIDLKRFTKITSPKYNKNLETYTMTLKSEETYFNFRGNNKELIQEWYNEINRSIRANNDNLLCTMLPSKIIIGPIASYLIGYKRYKTLSLINKYFSNLFNLDTFDFSGVYLSDSIYFNHHFIRFYNDNYFAITQGLYRSFYNPDNKYSEIYIDKIQRKQLLYFLMSYGSLVNSKQQQIQYIDYNHYIEYIPSNIIKYDFSRHLNQKSKLVALTFSEVRNEEDDESRIYFDEKKDQEEKINIYTGIYDNDNDNDNDNDEPHFNPYVYRYNNNNNIDDDNDNDEKYVLLKHDVKWIGDLLLRSHKSTFETIEILDLSHNAWDEHDILLICDSILRRNNKLRVKKLLLDGIPMLNKLKPSNKTITKLFEAISVQCDKLIHLSLNHCFLRDESCEIIKQFYKNNPKTSLMILDLINNNITEKGIKFLNEITNPNSHELAFVVGSFYSFQANKWNDTIKTDDNYSYHHF